ncbi:MAG: hypothetical protein ABIA59_04915 [Candidatus Latescibacterota bacterium]
MADSDIQRAIKQHANEIMTIPGVVGIASGVLRDGHPCILILVIEDTLQLRGMIPGQLDGFPVVINETGEIRALSDEEE